MYYSQRHEEILEILKLRNHVTVHYLAEQLHVSEPTIRRDLSVLEKNKRIRRTFGGAAIHDLTTDEVPLELRQTQSLQAKEQIARQALQYLQDGQVLFLDASSTVQCVVKHLKQFRDLTVITNSPKVSLMLAEQNIRSFCTGGALLDKSIAYVGNYAENFVRNFNADVFLFSCRGLSDRGMLTDSSVEESNLRRVMMKHAKKRIFLCTSDKIGKAYLYNLCSLSDVDAIECDTPLPPALLDQSV